jgi:nucleotidyltransferase/DNA polymerase involved in DNA repair
MSISKETLKALRGGTDDEKIWRSVIIRSDTLSSLLAAAEEAESLRAQLDKVRNETLEEAATGLANIFADCRFSSIHIQLGDIRLTLGHQDEIVEAIRALKTEVKG